MAEARGHFGNPEDGSQLPLETVARELVKTRLTEKTKRLPQ
jgi:hypothetical protein